MSEFDIEALQQRVLELQDQLINLQTYTMSLERRTDTIFCRDCPNKCAREKISCQLCKTINPPSKNMTETGLISMERPKVYISSPTEGDGSSAANKANWAKARAYASMAYKEGYMPSVPQLYFTLFIDNAKEEDLCESREEGTGWLFEVYLADGELWVCSEPDRWMKREILIAESLHMTIRYMFDHPLAAKAPQKPVVAEAPAQEEEPHVDEEPPTKPAEEKPKPSAADWVLKKLAGSSDVESVKRLRNWAAKNVPSPELTRVNGFADEKIKTLKAA